MSAKTNLRAIGLGALSGLRSMGPSVVLARKLGRRRRRNRGGGRGLPLLAVGEALVDKLPFAPRRTRVPSLLARMAAGAWVGAKVAGRGNPWLGPMVLGASAAVASTHAAVRLREAAAHRSKTAGYAVALAEDALVFWGGRRLAK